MTFSYELQYSISVFSFISIDTQTYAQTHTLTYQSYNEHRHTRIRAIKTEILYTNMWNETERTPAKKIYIPICISLCKIKLPLNGDTQPTNKKWIRYGSFCCGVIKQHPEWGRESEREREKMVYDIIVAPFHWEFGFSLFVLYCI